jgi:hypothetical protein
MALLPLPALLCAGVICVLAIVKLVRGDAVALVHEVEAE